MERKYNRRLLKLADLLDEDAKNKKGIRFDMGTFGRNIDESNPISCNTYACAMGLAALSGAFKREGLTAEIQAGYVEFIIDDVEFNGFDASQEFFGLNSQESLFIFGPFSYGDNSTGARCERRVAKRIRQFVAGEVKPD